MNIREEMIETFNDTEIETIFSRGEIIEMVYKKFKRNKDSIIPSDYCYNRINFGIDFEKSLHLFEYTADKKYRYLGANYPYSGKIYQKPKGKSEICIGEMVNKKVILYDVPEQAVKKATRNHKSETHTTKREISQSLRYKVLKRDNFKCCACGASPAKDPSVVLHVDHIIPWSKGGETEISNLQTLCSKCNLGKSDAL